MDRDAAGKQPNTWTVEDIFNDFKARRATLLRALTHDAVEVYNQCDPGNRDLRLYGLPSGHWEISDTPTEASLRDLPKPPRIHYVRNVMPEQNWPTMVAAGSELWLYTVVNYFANRSGLATGDRTELHNMIGRHPKLVQAVRGYHQKQQEEPATTSSTKAKEDPKMVGFPNTVEECQSKRARR